MELFSTECNEIFAALAKAQGSFPSVSKSGHNPHFKSTFSTLEDIEKSCRPSLAANGLGYTQLIVDSEVPQLITVLTHSSGQWIKSSVALKPSSWEAQKVGAYITYMRRYALGALLGIVGCEDDDGNDDSKAKATNAYITAYQLSLIRNNIGNCVEGAKVLDTILDTLKISDLKDIKAIEYARVSKFIQDKLKESKS